MEIPSILVGAVLGTLSTGFAFAFSTAQRLAVISARLEMVEKKVDSIARFSVRHDLLPRS